MQIFAYFMSNVVQIFENISKISPAKERFAVVEVDRKREGMAVSAP